MKQLIVNNLSVCIQGTVVNNISFDIEPGTILGLVGESGSGKSMTALALMDLLPDGATCDFERLEFQGEERKPTRGNEIAIVFQEPMTSLNPVMTIGKQVGEVLQIHQSISGKEVKEQVLAMFSEVGLGEDEKLFKKYPHELSGGMRQRVMIAMAMIGNPKILIADEPTTALDRKIGTQILERITSLAKERNMAVLLISHDIKLVHTYCQRAMVMKQGEIVEKGEVDDIFLRPQHEYTKSLVAALPDISKKEVNTHIKDNVVLSVDQISFYYERKVIDQVSFHLNEGEILGIMGESGCGKSTLSHIIAGLKKPKTGTVSFQGPYPRMVFQDPYSSLNPSKTVGWILEEPIKILSKKSKQKISRQERKKKAMDMLVEVGLSEEYLSRKIRYLSGGQRQRVAIAAALITSPKVIILDEPVSALDVTVQQIICDLLIQCKNKFGLSYLFISHDKDVVDMMCDRVLYMKDGKVRRNGE